MLAPQNRQPTFCGIAIMCLTKLLLTQGIESLQGKKVRVLHARSHETQQEEGKGVLLVPG